MWYDREFYNLKNEIKIKSQKNIFDLGFNTKERNSCNKMKIIYKSLLTKKQKEFEEYIKINFMNLTDIKTFWSTVRPCRRSNNLNKNPIRIN